jgi:hypothetical protein
MSDSSPAPVVASRLRLLLRILDRQSRNDDQHLTKAGRALCPPAAFVPDPPDAPEWDDLVIELRHTGLVRQRQRHALTWMADAGVDRHIMQLAAGHQDPAVRGWLPASRRAGHAERRDNLVGLMLSS